MIKHSKWAFLVCQLHKKLYKWFWIFSSYLRCHPDLAFIGGNYSLHARGLTVALSIQWEPEIKTNAFKM